MEVRERIVRQASLVEDLVGELEVEKSYGGVERLVQLILQALLDLGAMVISALGGPRPRSYSEIGPILKEMAVIGEEEAKLLKSMAGLRNLLVHAYAVVEREMLLRKALARNYELSSYVAPALRRSSTSERDGKREADRAMKAMPSRQRRDHLRALCTAVLVLASRGSAGKNYP